MGERQTLAGRVAIVTGAGSGLGRAHAFELARHGALLVLNDMGDAAHVVAQDIERSGGSAMVSIGDVTDAGAMDDMAAKAMRAHGRIDILVNNAGILRDKSFAKMSVEDFRRVLEVHVMGAVHATKAVWPHMQAGRHGRIVMTTSSSGLYGNFGQSNYGAAKMALVGLMQTLALEGERHDIRVNCLAPTALTAMTQGLLPPGADTVLTPERVSPGLILLVGDDAPTRMILLAGGGSFETARITMTRGLHIADGEDAASTLAGRLAELGALEGETAPASAWEQSRLELEKAGFTGPASSSV